MIKTTNMVGRAIDDLEVLGHELVGEARHVDLATVIRLLVTQLKAAEKFVIAEDDLERVAGELDIADRIDVLDIRPAYTRMCIEYQGQYPILILTFTLRDYLNEFRDNVGVQRSMAEFGTEGVVTWAFSQNDEGYVGASVYGVATRAPGRWEADGVTFLGNYVDRVVFIPLDNGTGGLQDATTNGMLDLSRDDGQTVNGMTEEELDGAWATCLDNHLVVATTWAILSLNVSTVPAMAVPRSPIRAKNPRHSYVHKTVVLDVQALLASPVIKTIAQLPVAAGGTHASPREHERRGHYRTYKSGKTTWVAPMMVNRGCGRVIKTTHIVDGAG